MKNLDGLKGPLRKHLHMWKRHPFDMVIYSRRNYAHPRRTITRCCTVETGRLSSALHTDVELQWQYVPCLPYIETGQASHWMRAWVSPLLTVPAAWDPSHICSVGCSVPPMSRHSPPDLWDGREVGAPHCRVRHALPSQVSPELGQCSASSHVGKEHADHADTRFCFFLQHSFLNWKLVTWRKIERSVHTHMIILPQALRNAPSQPKFCSFT